MNRKIVLLFSGVLALLAVLLMQLYKRNLVQEVGGGSRVKILAAKETIDRFSAIDRSQLMVVEYPEKYLPPGSLPRAQADNIIGQTTAFSIQKGDPVLSKDLASTQSEAQLSGMVQDKERALALPVDKVNSFGGLLRPNDHVDSLGTFQKPGQGDVETVTLLQNVTVLAVGGRLGSGDGAGRDRSRKGGRGTRVSTVTVLVNPVEAELLVFAQDRGKLSLTMRNKGDLITDLELEGKNFADIFEPKRIRRIQKGRDDSLVIKKAGARGRGR